MASNQCCKVAEDAVTIQISGNSDEFRSVSLAELKSCAEDEDLVRLWQMSRPQAVVSSDDVQFELVEHDEESWVELREAIEEYEEAQE